MLKSPKDRALIGVIVAAAIVGVVGWLQYFDDDHAHSDNAGTAIAVPPLSAEEKEGNKLFEENCIACHGRHATGSDQGPPLVHRIYEPNHHGDIAFQLAVKRGVRSHHWQFGDMAPVEGVSDNDVRRITLYVRALQRANGIY